MRNDRLARWLRELPLERKLVMAHLVTVATVTGTAVVMAMALLAPRPGAGAILLLIVVLTAIAALGIAMHRRLVDMLLRPLHEIERTLRAAEQGNLRARAQVARDADPGLLHAAVTLNRLLAGTHSDRQRLRDVAARAFRAQEAERLRIARELQEETAQTLTTALFLLRAARQTSDATARDGMLDELRQSLTTTTDSIRAYARALHPPSLKELGVVPALESYARALSGSSGLQIQILGDELEAVLPIEGELALYRIVQEALGNVVRHAGASRVLVRVRHAGAYVRTFVEDDGRGFAVDETEARLPCLGLFGMRERALSVGGTVEIDSIPGDGTRVQVSIPVAAHPAATPSPWPIIMRPAERPQPGQSQQG
jgi:two-component system, NarL family, sensor histidine kinase UhpB